MRWFVPLLLTFLVCGSRAVRAQELLPDPGFEVVESVTTWKPYEGGFQAVGGGAPDAFPRTGKRAIRCSSSTLEQSFGASALVTLNQKTPQPLVVSGWSRAQDVEGTGGAGYSVYVDVTFTDDSHLWGQSASFAPGTHPYQKRQVLLDLEKPVKSLAVYALFRGYRGTVWFDDFSVRPLSGSAVWDRQEVAVPRLGATMRSGWFVRDVRQNAPVVLLGTKPDALGLRAASLHETATGAQIALTNTGQNARCVTVYYVERFADARPVWHHDIHRAVPVVPGSEYQTTETTELGATGTVSPYPFGCVTGRSGGRLLGLPPDAGPHVARFGFHSAAQLFYAAVDIALLPGRTTEVRVVRGAVNPAWGFRAALQEYARRFPDAFQVRAKQQGPWIPFADPAKVQGVERFHLAFHEGDGTIASDDRLGVYSFRYSEPQTWWMPMPPEMPRTGANARALAERLLVSGTREEKRQAESLFASGVRDRDGNLRGDFRNTPWANGIVWYLSASPTVGRESAFAGGPPWTKARSVYDADEATTRYADTRPGSRAGLDGEYLDSLESWADVPDFNPLRVRSSRATPTFSQAPHQPVVPLVWGVWELAAHMSVDLHRRGKLLMANTTPLRWGGYLMPLLDAAGIEVTWMNADGTWAPDTDRVLCLRRSLSYRKPYLLLQNVDFTRFAPHGKRYFDRTLFWGIYPSYFSPDAASGNYWENPKFYEPDAPRFEKYIPLIQQMNRAGWEPVTRARTDKANVYVERWGARFLSVLNDNAKASVKARLTVEPGLLTPGPYVFTERLTGREIAVNVAGGKPVSLTLELAPEQVQLWEMRHR